MMGLLLKITNDDQIHHSDGVIFTINESLGSGHNFIIFSVLEYPSQAIRFVKYKY